MNARAFPIVIGLFLLLCLPELAWTQFGGDRFGGEGGFRGRGGPDRGRSRSGGDPSEQGGSPFRSGPPIDRIMGFMDRDRSGSIEPEEFERMPAPIRDAVKAAGFDTERTISTEELIRNSDRISQEMRPFGEVREEMGARSSRSGSDRSSSRGSSRRGEPEKPAERPRVTVDLPATYVPLDANKDGQVALHEWNRARLAEFLLLDRNRDGFLTPRELVAAQATGTGSLVGSTPSASTSVTSGSPMARPSASTATASSETASAESASTAAASASTASEADASDRAADALRRRAGYVFGALDKDKDGKLSEAEWLASTGTRATFDKAGVKLAFPVEKDAFVAAYPSGG